MVGALDATLGMPHALLCDEVSRIAPRIVSFVRGGRDISDGAAALASMSTCGAAGAR